MLGVACALVVGTVVSGHARASLPVSSAVELSQAKEQDLQKLADPLAPHLGDVRAKKKKRKKTKIKGWGSLVYDDGVWDYGGKKFYVEPGSTLYTKFQVKTGKSYKKRKIVFRQKPRGGDWSTVWRGTTNKKGKKKILFGVPECGKPLSQDCSGVGRVQIQQLVVKSGRKAKKAKSQKRKLFLNPEGWSEDENFIYYNALEPFGGDDCAYSDCTTPAPVIVTFSPTSDPNLYKDVLQDVADKYGFIVMSSKYYRNSGVGPLPDGANLLMKYASDGTFSDLGNGYATAKSQIDKALNQWNVDRSRVVLLGFSGGGSMAHAMNILYPKLADAIVVNTSMIWGEVLQKDGSEVPLNDRTICGAVNGSLAGVGSQFPGECANGPDRVNGKGSRYSPPFWDQYLRTHRTTADYSDSRKLAAFLPSPTGMRYQEMLEDEKLYQGIGWTVKSFPFDGGHKVAPQQTYLDAFQWLTSQHHWQGN